MAFGRLKLILLIGISALPLCTYGSDSGQERSARFHHVRINAMDPQASIAYYQKYFSAVPVEFRGTSDAILTDRSHFLFDQAAEPVPGNDGTALWHVGWVGIDGPSEHKWRTDQGMEWNTELTEVGAPGTDMHVHFMYASGPDKEIIEVWTGTPWQRYNHVHLLTHDVNATRDWYIDNLGAEGDKKPRPKPSGAASVSVRTMQRRSSSERTNYTRIVGNARAKMAGDLLKFTDATMAEIADELGFSHQGDFTRTFRRWAGVAPREYRKQRLTG